jgi:carbohydrate-binding DOMON domain-containing protein
MSVNKKDYKVVEEKDGYMTWYLVKKKFLWFFWNTIKNNSGSPMRYTSRKAAQAYINFLK